MIREVIRPQSDNFTIKIPKEYIDREVEFIMFALDEQKSIKSQKIKTVGIESLKGVFHSYADPLKLKLENKAWEIHILNIFGSGDFSPTKWGVRVNSTLPYEPYHKNI